MARRVKEFWGDFFGIEPQELDRTGVQVVAHRGLGDYSGAWVFWRKNTILLSTPADLVAATRQAVEAAGDIDAPEALAHIFVQHAERLVGPAYQGYLDPSNFRPCHGPDVVPLLTRHSLLGDLAAECDPDEWSAAGIDPERPEPCFGYLCGDRIVAAVQNAFWAESTVSPGLIVHPDFRGRGYGKAVLSAAVSDALEQDHLVLYQTLWSNTCAVRAAAALGFTPFASHLAVRFRT